MKIGVTGATGHIGNNLVRRLVEEGHQVRIFVHKKPGIFDSLPLDIVYGDMLDEGTVKDFVEGLDAVYHLAARIFIDGRHSMEYFRQNVEGTRIILDVAKGTGIKRFVYFSSIHAYDSRPLDQPLDESRPLAVHDRYLYNRSKALSQQMVLEASGEGLNALVLNPTAVIGPNDYKPSLLGQAVIRLAKGKLPALIPGGYDWVDVRDVAEAALRALSMGNTGEAYLISGHWHSLSDLYEEIRKKLSVKKQLYVLPAWLARIGVPFLGIWSALAGQEPLYTQGSITFLKHSNRLIKHEKATRDLDYHPRTFESTVADTLDWFRQMKLI